MTGSPNYLFFPGDLSIKWRKLRLSSRVINCRLGLSRTNNQKQKFLLTNFLAGRRYWVVSKHKYECTKNNLA
jgi:hypothetical protein